MVSSLILLRSLRVYTLKQLFFSISVNSGFTSHSDSASQINIEGFSELPFKGQANAINVALLKPLGEYKLPAPLERIPLESDSPEILRVTEQRVQRALDVFNPRKACGPDRTPSWLLKE